MNIKISRKRPSRGRYKPKIKYKSDKRKVNANIEFIMARVPAQNAPPQHFYEYILWILYEMSAVRRQRTENFKIHVPFALIVMWAMGIYIEKSTTNWMSRNQQRNNYNNNSFVVNSSVGLWALISHFQNHKKKNGRNLDVCCLLIGADNLTHNIRVNKIHCH